MKRTCYERCVAPPHCSSEPFLHGLHMEVPYPCPPYRFLGLTHDFVPPDMLLYMNTLATGLINVVIEILLYFNLGFELINLII